METKEVEIGTSGYTYPHWKKIFYPEDLPPGKWLEFYDTQFSTVELNVSFYRLPLKSVFAGWKRRSPEAFSFFVKGSRYITHSKRLKDCGKSIQVFLNRALALQEKLAGVLWQLPPRMKKDALRLKTFLSQLARYKAPHQVFEFRHESWFDLEITGLLQRAGAVYCRADRRDFYNYVQIPDTAGYVYLRRHGDPVQNSYPDSALCRDAAEIHQWLAKRKHIYVYFNNDGEGAAIHDARRLAEFLEETDPNKKIERRRLAA